MREIKFRAWDKAQKVMREVCKIDISNKFLFCNQYYLNQWKYSEMELMQFTGLKDKNGKECFEGDIVRCLDKSGEKVYDREMTMEMAYCEIWGKGDAEFEIIGNIYEHSNLLKT